jgi:hypothetical protein
MATIIKIKRTTGATAPSGLNQGELAYVYDTSAASAGAGGNGLRLFIGDPTSNSNSPIEIAGEYFTNLLDHSHGVATASSSVLLDSNKKIDEWSVDNLKLDGRIISSTDTNGNIEITPHGSGKSVIKNIYVDNTSTSLQEYIEDISGGSVTAGEGIDVTYDDAAGTTTISGEDATDSNKGIASFSANDFSVSSGAVTVKAGGISNTQLAGSIAISKLATSSLTIGSDTISLGGTQTDLNGITSLDVDNITIDGNTVSTTNSNGNIALAPNGTGSVTVPSGYEARAGFSSDSLVNKTYVDSVANGLDVKASVRVATTANLSVNYNNGAGTLTATSNGAIAVDGVTLSLNDRVLVKNQSVAAQNGFYKVTTTGSGSAVFVLTRTPDADAASELTSGAFTFTEEGTVNADNGYVLSTNGAIVLGTTSINFEQFSGAGQISAGNGLTKSGNTIDAVGTADKISVSADAITIANTYVGQTSITTLGTIATGTWNGSVIGEVYGGTGQSSYTTGDILFASGSNTLAKLALSSNGKILQSNGTNVTYGDIDGGTY